MTARVASLAYLADRTGRPGGFDAVLGANRGLAPGQSSSRTDEIWPPVALRAQLCADALTQAMQRQNSLTAPSLPDEETQLLLAEGVTEYLRAGTREAPVVPDGQRALGVVLVWWFVRWSAAATADRPGEFFEEFPFQSAAELCGIEWNAVSLSQGSFAHTGEVADAFVRLAGSGTQLGNKEMLQTADVLFEGMVRKELTLRLAADGDGARAARRLLGKRTFRYWQRQFTRADGSKTPLPDIFTVSVWDATLISVAPRERTTRRELVSLLETELRRRYHVHPLFDNTGRGNSGFFNLGP